MIYLDRVCKSYALKDGGRHEVFRDVTFRFPSRANVGVLGLNGAGKSTLLRMIGGSELPNAGRIVRDGVSISWPLGLAGGFQGSLSARENVQFVCRVHGLDRAQISAVEDFVQQFSEIGEFFDQAVKTYSSGDEGEGLLRPLHGVPLRCLPGR